MGISLMGGSSSSSTDRCSCKCSRCTPEPFPETRITQSKSGLRLPNPDPNNWRVLRYSEEGRYLLIELMYPDCTNYEGRKIMLFFDVTLVDLQKQKTIDPHFSENTDYHSPIARFEPTQRGWETARFLMKELNVIHTIIISQLF